MNSLAFGLNLQKIIEEYHFKTLLTGIGMGFP